MVQHCHIEFVEHPQQTYPVNCIKFSPQEGAIVDDEVQQLLKKGVIEEVMPCNNHFSKEKVQLLLLHDFEFGRTHALWDQLT